MGRGGWHTNFDVIEGGARQKNAELVTKGQYHKQGLVDLAFRAAAVAAGGSVPCAEPHDAARLLRLLRHAVRVGTVGPRRLPALLRVIRKHFNSISHLYDVLEHVHGCKLWGKH